MLIKADLTFERPPALVRDLNPSDLERSASGYPDFALCRCEPVTHQIEQFGREPRKEHWVSAAVLSTIGEHFECRAGRFRDRDVPTSKFDCSPSGVTQHI